MLLGSPKLYYINSLNRNSGSSSDFYYTLENLSSYTYDRITLMGCSIPKTWYLIDSRHNSFTLTEDAIDITITLDIGNYTALTLATLIGNIMTAESLASGNGWTYECRFNKVNGHFIITVSGNTSQPSITIPTGDFRLSRILGLDVGINSFDADVLESTKVINLQLTNSVNILCDAISDQVLQDIYSSNIDFTSVEFINQNPAFTGKNIASSNSNVIRITLVDAENLEVLDLNQADITLTLCFYKHNDYYEKAIEDKRLEIIEAEAERDRKEIIRILDSMKSLNNRLPDTETRP